MTVDLFGAFIGACGLIAYSAIAISYTLLRGRLAKRINSLLENPHIAHHA